MESEKTGQHVSEDVSEDVVCGSKRLTVRHPDVVMSSMSRGPRAKVLICKFVYYGSRPVTG